MKVEIKHIKYNELLETYQINLRFTDPKYKNPQTNKDDPEYHTICYLACSCNKEEDIKPMIQRESYNTWLRINSEYYDEPVTDNEFEIDNATGELL